MIKQLIRQIPVRRLSRGVEIWHIHRICFTKNWRSKPHPYFFHASYGDGTRTLQIMRVEYWYRPFMTKKVLK